MPRRQELLSNLEWLDARALRIWHDEDGHLCMKIEGRGCYKGVQPVRMFPLTARDRMISIMDKDGNEIGVIRELRELDARSRKELEDELAERYFIPRILRIYSIATEFGVTKWDVETDHGRRQFTVRERSEVRLLTGCRVLIRDADGNPYEIPDYTTLDPRSRALLEEQL